ncbi:MAG: tRNA dihydrouridine synthase DusB [Clostridiaceae bacterium]|nr:tRNA dihydrouridine synthase DusB [Clostridiaceae bacterium]
MISVIHPLDIGTVKLENNLALAPMSGTSDLAFRHICRRMGAGLTVTELVSARGMAYDPTLQRNWRYLAIDPADNPVAIQLFGSDPADFQKAIRIIGRHPVLQRCSLIDLNMGCPVAKVIRTGGGSALMRTPGLAARIVAASVAEAANFNLPVTVKFRKGWDDSQVNAVEFARLCADGGAAGLTIHGRTREQMYGGKADWQIIAAVKDAVSIPVFGNGDIRSASDAERLLAQTRADGVMIGRAAQGNPWIFRQILAALDVGPPGKPADMNAALKITPEERIDVFFEHLNGLCALIGEATAAREMRKHLAWYMKGLPGAAAFKAKGMTAESCNDLRVVWEDWRIYCQKYCVYLS